MSDTRFRSRPIARQRLLAGLLALVLVAAVPVAASARDSAGRKAGRGVANFTLGVLAIPGQMVATTRESGPFVGATWGLVKGAGTFVATELVGLFEIATFPFETPPGYKPILDPEFPWDYYAPRRAGSKD